MGTCYAVKEIIDFTGIFANLSHILTTWNPIMQPIVLASSSPYRKTLLSKLNFSFVTDSPDIDETALIGEAPTALVERLATEKTTAIISRHPAALIIGSDQVASVNGTILSKPGSFDKAFAQLQQCSANTVTYYTGLCLLNAATNNSQVHTERYQLNFRTLTDQEISNYLQLEQPYDCAGSIKSEGLAVSLFQSHHGRDPNALIGLPLIQLLKMLRTEGVNPLLS
ncbi:MAG: MAF protein [Porticoccus sp.]